MDHNVAETQQWADKYTLNELSGEERAQFEEHMFDCPVCSEQVRQVFTVVENLKEVLREEKVAASESVSVPSAGWRKWFQLPTLVPSFVALALTCVVIYQDAGAPAGYMAQVLTPGSVVGSVERGAKEVIHVNPKSPMFLVNFSVDARKPDAFSCEFQTKDGKKILSLNSALQNTASFNLPALLPTKSFPAGEYQMLLRPASEPDSITTYPFQIVMEELK